MLPVRRDIQISKIGYIGVQLVAKRNFRNREEPKQVMHFLFNSLPPSLFLLTN